MRVTSSTPAIPLGLGGVIVTEFTVTVDTRLKDIILSKLIIIFL